MKILHLLFALPLIAVIASSCAKKEPSPDSSSKHEHAVHKHEHTPPHGGVPIVLGAEVYHLELVLDAATGKLGAFILDGEMENYIRITAPSFSAVATVGDTKQTLVFKAVADSATGENVGDTALFEATADWLKTAQQFDAVLTKIEIRGSTFSDVSFNFPKGNDHD